MRQNGKDSDMRDHNDMFRYMRNGGEQRGNPGGHSCGYNPGNSGNSGNSENSGNSRNCRNCDYDDIINLPRHVSKTHPHMTITERAAQFSPFAALTGHADAIRETARLTEGRIVPDEDMLVRLDGQLAELARMSEAGAHPQISVTYFEADGRKAGGAYRTGKGEVKRIDPVAKKIVFTDRTEIELQDIYDIEITEEYN